MIVHVAPSYYPYRPNTYADITICTKCERTALYEDEHPVDPCPACGYKKRTYVGKWIKPTYNGFWPFRKQVTSGYWCKQNTVDGDK